MAMTRESMAERFSTIGEHLFDSVEGDWRTPLCEVLDAEIEPEDHDQIHALFNGIVAAGAASGMRAPLQFVAYAFVIGRKWGLMEAGESIGSFDADDLSTPE